ncbi:hypothetical protein AADZ86_08520 [Colwelliaceae bacterium BS250]
MIAAPIIGDKYVFPDEVVRQFRFHQSNVLYLVNENDPEDVKSYPRKKFDKDRILKKIDKVHSNEGYMITAHQKERAIIIKPYVDIIEQLISEGHCYTTKVAYDELITRVPMPAGRTKHYSRKHVCKWFKAYRDNSRYLELSVPERKPRSNQLPLNDEKCLNSFLYSGIDATLNNTQMHKKYADYVDNCRTTWEDESLNVVNISTMRRRLAKIPQITWADLSGDKEKVRDLGLTRQRKIRVEKALERVEIDCLHLNVALINDLTSEIITKVILYVALDVKTRYPISVVVQFGGGENSSGVLNLFRNMFIQSSDELNAFGKPLYVIGDNGPAFNNVMIDELAGALEFSYIRTASGAPQQKPFIESFFDKLRTEFCELKLVSYEKKYHNQELSTRQSKQLKDRVKITYKDFLHALNEHLVEYVNTRHETANLVPQEAWNEAINAEDVLQPSYEEIREKFHVETADNRSIYKGGEMSLGLQHFSHVELNDYRNELLKNSLNESPETTIRHDKFDIRSVTVIKREEGTCIGEKLFLPNLDDDIIKEEMSFDFTKENPEFNMFALNETILRQVDEVILRVNPGGIKKTKPRKSPRSGPEVSCYEENMAKEMAAKERIDQSNLFKATRRNNIIQDDEAVSADVSNKSQHDALNDGWK